MWGVLSGGSVRAVLPLLAFDALIMFNTNQLKQDNCNHMTVNSNYIILIGASSAPRRGNVNAFKPVRYYVVHIRRMWHVLWLKMKVKYKKWLDDYVKNTIFLNFCVWIWGTCTLPSFKYILLYTYLWRFTLLLLNVPLFNWGRSQWDLFCKEVLANTGNSTKTKSIKTDTKQSRQY